MSMLDTKTLYERVQTVGGRTRYVAVSELLAGVDFAEGHWLVTVRPGCKTIRRCLDPARAEVAAAMCEVEDAMVEALRKANNAIPNTPSQLSLSEQKICADFYAELGAWPSYTGCSMVDLVRAGVDDLRRRMDEKEAGE